MQETWASERWGRRTDDFSVRPKRCEGTGAQFAATVIAPARAVQLERLPSQRSQIAVRSAPHPQPRRQRVKARSVRIRPSAIYRECGRTDGRRRTTGAPRQSVERLKRRREAIFPDRAGVAAELARLKKTENPFRRAGDVCKRASTASKSITVMHGLFLLSFLPMP